MTSCRDMPMPLSEMVIVREPGVDADADLQVRIVLEERAVGDRLEPQLVARIRRVRHQLAQEDLLVPVKGVHHQVQELLDLRLEAKRFTRCCRIHRYLLIRPPRPLLIVLPISSFALLVMAWRSTPPTSTDTRGALADPLIRTGIVGRPSTCV